MFFKQRTLVHSILFFLLITFFVSYVVCSLTTFANAQNTSETAKYTTKEQYDKDFPPPPTESLVHNGVRREYILYLPQSYDGRSKMPILFNFHGFGGMARYHYYTADMRAVAESGQFLLVYPQGTFLNGIEGQAHWNAGLDTPENKSTADDFGFINALLDKLVATYRIDEERIYAIGYSNGGYFSYALACYYSDKIAAIASISGTMMLETYGKCDPNHRTGMLNIHGTKDSIVPYRYYAKDNLASIEAVLDYWATFNSSSTETIEPIVKSEGSIQNFIYTSNNGETFVEHYKVIDGEHVWFDFTFEGVSANQIIWNFLSRYSTNGLR